MTESQDISACAKVILRDFDLSLVRIQVKGTRVHLKFLSQQQRKKTVCEGLSQPYLEFSLPLLKKKKGLKFIHHLA